MSALSHVKSNPIADFTGTVTVFNSAGATETRNATDLVRPTDWNSAHNFFNTISGNTLGTSTASGTNLAFGASGGISASHSTAAGAATLYFSAPSVSSLSATGAVSVSTNGSTISIGVPQSWNVHAVSNTTQSSSGTVDRRSVSFAGAGAVSVGVSNGSVVISAAAGAAAQTERGFNPYADIEKIAGQYGQGTMQIDPVRAPNFSCDRVVIPINNTNSSNSSGSHTLSFWVGMYTRNDGTLSLYASASASTAVTHSGTAGSYSLYSGQRNFTFGLSQSFSAGDYWLAFVSRTTSGGANGSYSHLIATNIASNFVGIFGSAHNTTQQLTLGQGIYSVTTSGVPSSIAFSQINGSGSAARRAAFIMFASSTV